MSRMDLGYYRKRFVDALKARYDGETFDDGFRNIEDLYKEVRAGDRLLVAEDVMAIFERSLPFWQDWTKPDGSDLDSRMKEANVGDRIKSLGGGGYPPKLITEIWRCFRELSLTALVLHHVYPDRFAICSHHLASLLYISAPTVLEFYIKYCEELKLWSEGEWPRRRVVDERARHRSTLTVVDAEFALWTWYRLAYIDGAKKQRKEHREKFYRDPWVQERRAQRISESLGAVGKLDLAQSYVHVAPTVAAMIAWRELETAMRKILHDCGEKTTDNDTFRDLIERLPAGAFSRNLTKRDVVGLWHRRNAVIHQGEEIAENETDAKVYAATVLHGVVGFIEKNRSEVPSQ